MNAQRCSYCNQPFELLVEKCAHERFCPRRPPDPPAPPKYEYTEEYFSFDESDKRVTEINRLASLGWELITVDRGVAYFRRRIL